MDIAQRRGVADGARRIDRGNLVVVDLRTAQETRPVVRVLLDYLQHQRVGCIAVTHDREQQPVRVIELGTIEPAVRAAGELLHVDLSEFVALDGTTNLFVLRLDARRVEAGVLEDFHGPVRERRQ